MRQTIRSNVFETNSSTSHSVVVTTDEEQDLLEKDMLYIYSDGYFVLKQDLYKEFEKFYKDYPPEIKPPFDTFRKIFNYKTWEEFHSEYNIADTHRRKTKDGSYINIHVICESS